MIYLIFLMFFQIKSDQEADTEEIYEVLMEKQKEKITELKANIDEKIAFLKSETTGNSLINRTTDEIKISNFLNKSQFMPKKQGNSSEIPVVLAKEIHKKELINPPNNTNNKPNINFNNNLNNRSQLLNNSRDSSMINPQKNLGKLLNNSTNMGNFPLKFHISLLFFAIFHHFLHFFINFLLIFIKITSISCETTPQ